MKTSIRHSLLLTLCVFGISLFFSNASYSAEESFDSLVKRLQADKPKFAKRQQNLLSERYDLADRAVQGITMSRGKPVQGGVRVKLPSGTSWEELSQLSPEEIKDKNLWPAGFLPLPHPHHETGGMIFPKFLIDETKNKRIGI